MYKIEVTLLIFDSKMSVTFPKSSDFFLSLHSLTIAQAIYIFKVIMKKTIWTWEDDF